MKQTMIADSIDFVGRDAQYDHACRTLLANREILAWILKEAAEEFRDCDVKEIAKEYIQGEPRVASVPVNPGETNARILGLRNEDSVYGEGKITYDIHFQAVYPQGGQHMKLFVNVEGQKNFYPGYALPKRGIFYCCRMVSAQYGTEFTEPDYDDIKKVYSIWICMNPSKRVGNTIVKYAVRKEDVVGSMTVLPEDYEILTMVMICLGGEKSPNYEGILKLLDVLFSRERDAEEKKCILETEFGIEMTKKMEREVYVMCNFSEGLIEEVTREVTEKVTGEVTKQVTQEVTEQVTKQVTKQVTQEVTEQVEGRFESLNLKLLAEQRYAELEKASRDRAYREALCQQLGI